MLHKTLLLISQNSAAKEILLAVKNVAMVLAVLMALLMMDGKKLDFIYANF